MKFFSLKTIFAALAVAAMPALASADETLEQTLYFDFGPATTDYNGEITDGADTNGNYWNNISNQPDTSDKYGEPGASFSLVNSLNASTGYSLTFTTRVSTNGMSSGGGLTDPSADYLGDLAIATATEDYIYSESNQHTINFMISGLDLNKGYKFSVFASRTNTETRTGIYSMEGINSFSGTLQHSGSSIGAVSGANANESNILESDLVYPDSEGKIFFTIGRDAGTYIALNAMKVEEYSGGTRPSLGDLDQTFFFDFGPTDNTSRGDPTESPDTNGNYWNNITSTSSGSTAASGTVFSSLINSANTTTDYTLTLNSKFSTNGTSTNGGLTSPSTDFLGDLAVETATEDYYFFTASSQDSCKFTISGLDINKGYKFYMFACRTASETRTATYIIEGINSYSGSLQHSGSNIGGTGVNGNIGNILRSDLIYPDDGGNIVFTIACYTGTYIALSAIKVEEYSGGTRPGSSTSETLNQTLFFDFGAESSTSYGETTDGADSNGNYWNNITNQTDTSTKYAASGTVFSDLVNSENTATGYSVTLNSRFSTNNSGGLSDPSADYLGDLAIATATNDYYYLESGEDDSNFTISGLDPDKGYKFYIFASRSNTETRTATYTMAGINSFSGNLQHSGTDLGGDDVNQNISTILESDLVYPNDDGNILFTVSRYTGTYIALNAMKVEEYTGGTRPSVYTALTLVGTAAEDGTSTPMHEVAPNSTHTNYFELFTYLNDGTFRLQATDSNNDTFSLGADFTTDGDDFTPASTGLLYITVDLENNEIAYLPITSMGLTGSIVEGGWSLTDNANLDYQSEGVWKSTVALTRTSTVSDPERFNFVMNKSWDYTIKRVEGTVETVALASQGYSTEDIRLNHGTYTITLDLRDYIYTIESPDGSIDPLRISVMGSSVANGQGADDNEGYAYMYGEQLASRYESGESDYEFYISNISINGNSTEDLLARYNDLIHEFGLYVIFGLSLGNEGIHGASDQDAIFDQFKTNMQTLIAQARDDGKYPLMMNNYTRGDFTETDYEYIKKMNLLIHQWDLPSTNMLGAIDNGSGQWADGYQDGDDVYHPSTEGHQEFFYAMVPSLFDAIAAGKDLPERSSTSYSYNVAAGEVLYYSPEGTTHPFTIVLKVKGAPEGTLLEFEVGDDVATIEIDEDGTITYYSTTAASETATTSDDTPNVLTISGSITDTEGWNYITLTHYYAQGFTNLYVNSTLAGTISEKIAPGLFTICSKYNMVDHYFSELFFYRSGMNADEIEALVDGYTLKSSLELYVPFSDSSDELYNYAQSTNSIEKRVYTGITSVKELSNTLKVYSTPGQLHIEAAESSPVGVYGVDGTAFFLGRVEGERSLSVSPGLYIVNHTKVLVK